MKENIEKTLIKYKGISKSLIFLYPLLKLPRHIKPIGTYLGIDGYKIGSGFTLICLFHKDQEDFISHWRKDLNKNKMLDFSIKDGQYEYFIFDLRSIPKVYEQIKFGQYSNIKGNAKLIIEQNLHPITTMAMNPEKYYEDISIDLQVDLEQIIENVEVIPPPDVNIEYITISSKLMEEIKSIT